MRVMLYGYSQNELLLFYRSFDIKGVGFLSRVCIDIKGAPEVSMFIGGVKINANIRRLALGKQFLLEGCGKAVAGRIDGVNHELLVACITIDKVEGVTRIIPIQREVADGVIENDARRCRTFLRARKEKADKNDGQNGNNTSGMIHNNAQIKICV